MTKAARQKTILELLHKGPIESQEELQGFLAKRGFDVGQATLSRDIRELGLVKTYDGYMPANEVGMRRAGVALRVAAGAGVCGGSAFSTEPSGSENQRGSAQPVAAAVDSEDWPEVVGTLGGDDTILVISQDNKTAQQLARRIEGMLA